MVKIALVLAIILSVVLKADDHFLTMPVVGNDIEVEHAWYYANGTYHGAIDYTRETPGAILGQDILSAYGGVVVISVDNHVDYGTYVKIDHGNGYETLYAHMIHQSSTVNNGDYVYQGQVIGRVGSTGNSTGPHLHFELIYNSVRVDPYGWYQGPGYPYPNCNPDEYYWTSNPPIGPPNVSAERQLPDDLLVHVLGTPHYYWLQDGLMRGFNSEYPFYTWGLEWSDAVEITSEEFSNFVSGANMEVMLGAGVFDQNEQRWVFDYATDTSPVIVKRRATNWEQLGYAVDMWIPVSNDFMNQFNEGSELLSVSDYPYGTVLQNENNSSERYVLVKGDDYDLYGQKVKLPLFSDDVYNVNYYHHNFNVPVSSSVLANYPIANSQLLVMDGKLIMGSGPDIYYLENGQRRRIVDETSFAYYGFNYTNVHNVSNNLINAFPNGVDIFFSPSGGSDIYNGGELDDGGFDSGLEVYWLFSDWQEVADFEVDVGDNVSGYFKARASVYSPTTYYNVEVKQLVAVNSGQLYHTSFYARSDNPMEIKFNLGRDTSPWDNHGLWKEIITSNQWQKYQYIFTANDSDDLARLAFQIGEVPGELFLDKVVFTALPEILPSGDNLLANPNFEIGHYAPWQVEDHNSTASYYTDDFEGHDSATSFFVDPHQSAEAYHVQLNQLVNIQANQVYEVSFWAKASTERTVFLDLIKNGSPWTNYGLWSEITVNNDWNLYTVSFEANITDLARFTIQFGHQDIPVWIDDISLSISGVGIEDEVVQSLIHISQNYPNPFNPETRIDYSISDSYAELMIYNIKGQIVKNYNLSPDRKFIIWSGLNNSDQKVSSGVYLYTLKFGNQMTQMRKMILLK